MMDEFSKEANAAREQNKQALEAEIRTTLIGQILGFAIGVIAIGCGTYCGVSGAQITGSFIGSGGVIGLVSVFVLGRRKP
jgi:hypothetical protein